MRLLEPCEAVNAIPLDEQLEIAREAPAIL
jgi:hypothetical protein